MKHTLKIFGPGETIALDDNIFIDCAFHGCTIIYRGSDNVTMENCTVQNSPIIFEGAAGSTIQILQALLATDGDGSFQRNMAERLGLSLPPYHPALKP